MSYNEKPQLKLYAFKNNAFKLQAIIDDFQEVSFERNLYSAGTFTITINYNIPNALLFERGMFIQFGSDPYDFGEILSIRDVIGQDGKGSQIRTITGYDARYIFKRRIIKNLNANGMWKMTAKGEICLRNLIADQCGANAEEKRRLPVTNTIPLNENALGKEYSVSEQFTNLYEVCKTIATQSEIGWRVKFDNGSLKLECYEGTDRSDTVQFSTDFDSLRDGEFSDSSESYSNAIYIGGKGQNDERDIYEGEDGNPNGLERFEAWDDQSQMTTTDEYMAEALSMLTQYGQTVNVSGNGLAKCPYIYKEQYNVGDIITIAFSGKKAVVQILSVTERWAWNQYDINFSFGKPQNNLAEQIQLMLRKIQASSNKANATESVKWYTIPTAASMPKDDVTFNTIGFTGTLTANSTFTLYRDSEGTGSKSYNVYCKNLSGNYNLTLTTGVSGASNFTIKGGSNIVARILVDENGNIVSQSMTATDLIESGNNQPATSGAVAEEIENITEIASSLPTDAVLHYSFDEVPDYPDGTAVAKNLNGDTYDVTVSSVGTITTDAYAEDGKIHKSNVNGNATYKTNVGSNRNLGIYFGVTSGTGLVKIIEFEAKTPNIDIHIYYRQSSSDPRTTIYPLGNSISVGKHRLAVFVPQNCFEFSIVFYSYASDLNYTEWELTGYYLGNGSYSTPIIDNANGQNNATNNGGIAVQGVSGKGAYFLEGKYADLGTDFQISANFSFSIWSKLEGSDNIHIIRKLGVFTLVRINSSLVLYLRDAEGTALLNNSVFGSINNDEFTHIVVVRNGTNIKVFKNGVILQSKTIANATIANNQNPFTLGSSITSEKHTEDDFQLFNRALSDTEVQALYQNKANTPKYYSWADWKLSQV